MQNFLVFGLRSIFIGFLFYGIYFIFLKKMAPFDFIRFYLILALISMGIIPLLPWIGVHFPRIAIFSNIPLRIDTIKEIWLPIVSVNAKSRLPNTTGLSLFLDTYLILVGIQTFRLLWSFISVTFLWLRSSKTRSDGVKIAVTPKPVPVFSIFN